MSLEPTTVQLAKLIDSTSLDWSACRDFAWALIDLGDPVTTAAVLYLAKFPDDALKELWNRKDPSLRAQLIYHNSFLSQFNEQLAHDASKQDAALAALAARWNYLEKFASLKRVNKKTRKIIEKSLEDSSNPAVKSLWQTARGDALTPFQKSYVNGFVAFEDIQGLRPEDLILLPYLYPLTIFEIIDHIQTIDENARRGVINFAMDSQAPFYKLKLAQSLPDDSPELKVLRQDSDPSIAATASMKARNREQTVFLMDPLEAPRKLSPRKKKEEAAHDAIVNLYLKTIPSPRQFAIFWNRRVEISYNSIMGENSVEFITGEVVEKYLNERLSLEAEWNLQTLRGKIEPV